ncbi:MAG TPA: DUF6498-containing protein [Cytophagaceae bacterium]|jgi:hypothetical protein|nr:DUF6498-containing protein [Cytophagaceae bacterium]
MISLFSRISFLWLPIFDKQRYGPLGMSVEFLQNVFDVIFLLAFVCFWGWGPLLVILYYVLETVVMSVFIVFKLWKSKTQLYPSFVGSRWILHLIGSMTLVLIVSFLSWREALTAHQLLSQFMMLPSPYDVLLGDTNFSLGIVAIVIQQVMEYRKQKQHFFANEEFKFAITIFTPVVRLFIQQFSIIMGIVLLLLISSYDVKLITIALALILGLIKMVFGQLYVIPKEK